MYTTTIVLAVMLMVWLQAVRRAMAVSTSNSQLLTDNASLLDRVSEHQLSSHSKLLGKLLRFRRSTPVMRHRRRHTRVPICRWKLCPS